MPSLSLNLSQLLIPHCCVAVALHTGPAQSAHCGHLWHLIGVLRWGRSVSSHNFAALI
jgi:hypothetical protein